MVIGVFLKRKHAVCPFAGAIEDVIKPRLLTCLSGSDRSALFFFHKQVKTPKNFLCDEKCFGSMFN